MARRIKPSRNPVRRGVGDVPHPKTARQHNTTSEHEGLPCCRNPPGLRELPGLIKGQIIGHSFPLIWHNYVIKPLDCLKLQLYCKLTKPFHHCWLSSKGFVRLLFLRSSAPVLKIQACFISIWIICHTESSDHLWAHYRRVWASLRLWVWWLVVCLFVFKLCFFQTQEMHACCYFFTVVGQSGHSLPGWQILLLCCLTCLFWCFWQSKRALLIQFWLRKLECDLLPLPLLGQRWHFHLHLL